MDIMTLLVSKCLLRPCTLFISFIHYCTFSERDYKHLFPILHAGSEITAEIDDFDNLCDRAEGLKRFIEQEKCDRQQVELSVLYAMQAIAVANGVPKGKIFTRGPLRSPILNSICSLFWHPNHSL
jgi:hypothetical protein